MPAPSYHEPATYRRTAPPRRPRRAADPFGYDRDFHRQMRPFFEFLYRRYWRVRAEGLENVPSSGPVLIVANHSGGIPFDAAMLATAIELDHPRPRLVRFLYDRFVAGMPVVGTMYKRLGAVLASYPNARTLLERGEAVGIFPEGVEGVAKGIGHRYQLQSFRTGFVRLSLELRVPVVPACVVGAEEIYPVIGKWQSGLLKQVLSVPYVPLTPFFPLLGPFGMLPLPTRWQIRFGEPIRFEVGTRTDSRRVLTACSEQVRRKIQGMVHELLARRESLF